MFYVKLQYYYIHSILLNAVLFNIVFVGNFCKEFSSMLYMYIMCVDASFLNVKFVQNYNRSLFLGTMGRLLEGHFLILCIF